MILPILASLLGLSATPLNEPASLNVARSVVSTLSARSINVSIQRTSVADRLSPLLTVAEESRCSIVINTGLMASSVWTAYLADVDGEIEAALRDFAIAHEVGHCILFGLRSRLVTLPPLHSTSGFMEPDGFKTLVHIRSQTFLTTSPRQNSQKTYDEYFCDLVGLRFVQLAYPKQFDRVHKHLVLTRKNFAALDPGHDSSPFLSAANMDAVARLMTR